LALAITLRVPCDSALVCPCLELGDPNRTAVPGARCGRRPGVALSPDRRHAIELDLYLGDPRELDSERGAKIINVARLFQ